MNPLDTKRMAPGVPPQVPRSRLVGFLGRGGVPCITAGWAAWVRAVCRMSRLTPDSVPAGAAGFPCAGAAGRGDRLPGRPAGAAAGLRHVRGELRCQEEMRREPLPKLTGAGKLYRARSRLHRSHILQVNMRLKALAEIYTMHSFAQL